MDIQLQYMMTKQKDSSKRKKCTCNMSQDIAGIERRIRVTLMVAFLLLCVVGWQETHAYSAPPHPREVSVRPFSTSLPWRVRGKRYSSSSLEVSATSETENKNLNAEYENAEKMEQKLRILFQTYENTKHDKDKPPEDLFVNMIESWLKFPLPSRAEIVLDKMEELYQPDGRLYERLVNAWCFEAEQESTNPLLSETAALLDDDVNEDEENESISEQQKLKLEQGKVKATKASQMAMGILNRMEQLYRETGDVDFRPALSTYTSVMNAFRRSGAAASGTMELIEHLTQRRDIIYQPPDAQSWKLTSDQDVLDLILYLDNNDDNSNKKKDNRNSKNNNAGVSRIIKKLVYKKKGSLATTRNFNIIINELAKSNKLWAGQRAEDILDYMIHQCRTGQNKFLEPDIITINGCIDAWARSSPSQLNSAFRAQEILQKLQSVKDEYGILKDVIPDTVTYNCLINAWAKSKNSNQAEATLAYMEELSQSSSTSHVKPDIVTYCSVLNALANVAHEGVGAAKKAEAILTRMHQQYQESDRKNNIIKPNTRCFNIVIKSHANSREPGSGNRALLLLELMQDMATKGGNTDVVPDTFSYNTVLKALGNCRQAKKAHEVLERMEKEFENGNHRVRPDTISYNTVIRAYAKSGSKGSGKAAEKILNKMLTLDNKRVRPDTSTYTSVVKAWTENGGTGYARRVEGIVDALEKKSKQKGNKHVVKADTTIYNALLDAWAKSYEWGSAQRCEEILSKMESMYRSGIERVKPNTSSYTCAIVAYAKSREVDASKRAEKILSRMESISNSGNLNVRPNVVSYTAVINCIARSKESRKAFKAMSILQRMEEQYRLGNTSARPNVLAYNNVLNACAYTSGDREEKEEAFKVACIIFDEIRTSDYLRLTHVTYGTFLAACGNLMPVSDMRNKLVEATFRRCCHEGLVSDLVIRHCKRRTSKDMFIGLMNDVQESELPSKWTRNIAKRERSAIIHL